MAILHNLLLHTCSCLRFHPIQDSAGSLSHRSLCVCVFSLTHGIFLRASFYLQPDETPTARCNTNGVPGTINTYQHSVLGRLKKLCGRHASLPPCSWVGPEERRSQQVDGFNFWKYRSWDQSPFIRRDFVVDHASLHRVGCWLTDAECRVALLLLCVGVCVPKKNRMHSLGLVRKIEKK